MSGGGGSVGKDSRLDVDGLACILVRALEGEADWVADDGGEGGLVSWSRGVPNWGIVGLLDVEEIHQKVNHHEALSVANDNGGVVESLSEGLVVP